MGAIPTVTDWIQRAKAAPTSAERDEALERGVGAANAVYHWRALASAFTELFERPEAARDCLERALAMEPMEVRVAADLARLWVGSFEDRVSATRVLEATMAALMAGEWVPPYEWSQLATAFKEIVEHDTLAATCLGHGAERMDSVDALCTIGAAYFSVLDDLEGARSLVLQARERAEREASWAGTNAFWTVMNAQHAIGDDAEVEGTLDLALSLAVNTSQCVTLANAWASHARKSQQPALRCMAKAKTFAKTGDEWLIIARGFHQHTSRVRLCADALDKAAKLGDATVRRRAAHGVRHWLGDAEAAAAIAPTGLAPLEIGDKKRSFEGWVSDPETLLGLLMKAATPANLKRIAEADYGYGAEDNLHALRDIQTTGLLPVPLDVLHEVCALCRWTSGDHVDHVERALACTLLCLDFPVEGTMTDDLVATIAPLVESAVALGPAETKGLIGLLVWLLEVDVDVDEGVVVDPEDESNTMLAARFGILLAQASLDASHAGLDGLADEILMMEKSAPADAWYVKAEGLWLTRIFDCINDALWRHVGREILDAAAKTTPPGSRLFDIRALLEGG